MGQGIEKRLYTLIMAFMLVFSEPFLQQETLSVEK